MQKYLEHYSFHLPSFLYLSQTNSTEVTVATVLALYNHVVHQSSPNAEVNVMKNNVIDVCSQITSQTII